jgi:DnaK suppressor protein
MDQEQREQLRQQMQQQLTELKERIAQLEEATQPISPDNAYGRLSRMDAINNKSVNESALRTARAKQQKLEKALTKVDEPDFGHCTLCGRPIQAKRLMFLPESTRCVQCADR